MLQELLVLEQNDQLRQLQHRDMQLFLVLGQKHHLHTMESHFQNGATYDPKQRLLD